MAAFDAVNTTLTFTWAYYTAARGNPHHTGGALLLDRLVKSPPLYGIAAGLLVNATGVQVPSAIVDPIKAFGSLTGALISVGVGILFTPPGAEIRKALLIVVTRLVTGLAVGGVIVLAFGLAGIDRTIVLLPSVAPVGFVSVTFASLEKLDVRLATSALSLSMVFSLVLSIMIGLTLG